MPAMLSSEHGYGRVSKSMFDYPYLPADFSQRLLGITPTRRNPISPLVVAASSRNIIEADAKAHGRKMSDRMVRRLGDYERSATESRMMMFAPFGRGSVM